MKYHLKLTPDINVNPMKHLVVCVVLVASNETIEVYEETTKRLNSNQPTTISRQSNKAKNVFVNGG